MKKMLIVPVIAAAVIGLAGLPLMANAATTDTTIVNVDIADTLSITSTESEVTINLTPMDSTQVSSTATETITGNTNNPGGFKITAKTATTDGSLSTDGTTAAGPIAKTANGASLSANSWGAKFAAGSGAATAGATATGNYIGLTGTDTAIANTTSVGDKAFTVTYGASANTAVPAGTYKTTVTYTIANN